jgi:hypothetical protein
MLTRVNEITPLENFVAISQTAFLGQKTCLFQAFSVITTRVNISWRAGVFWPGGLQHHNFFIFDGKQHPKNIWFHGC